ncbi:MAG TPA: DUF2007 domain-containing protein [Pirellulales bacterium]|nr:DUF2007 domain-containing protein [Pirellulales bacterium]
MSDQPTVIYTAANPLDAHELRNLLADEGIEAYIINDALQAVTGEVPLGWATAARVLVAQRDAPRARTLAEAFDRQTVAVRREPRSEAATTTTPLTLALCPECCRQRTAVCPICETAGADFLSGDMPPAAETNEGETQLLICPTCDEPFEPGYLRDCEWCGHDCGDGIRLPAPPVEDAAEAPNARAIAAALGMIVIIAAIMAYFAWLF